MSNSTDNRQKRLPKIGKRGWIGVFIACIGLLTLFGARKSADDLINTTWETQGSDHVFADEALAKGAGYNSYSDFLAEENRNSGTFALVVGSALIIWGYRKYKSTP